jgi:CRISPR-associated protein Cas5t
MDTRRVLRVTVSGSVTSFRYPFFTHGFQPTFEMPPPSTIHGHICSAVGDWIEPDRTFLFGYHFTHQGKFIDFKEHLHVDDPIQPAPLDRELLFNPILTLYLTRLDLAPAFRSPHFTLVLGRSQDLMTCLSVQEITLERRYAAYFDRTLLPQWMAPRLERPTLLVRLARFIDQHRYPYSGNYAMLLEKAVYPPSAVEGSQGLEFEGDNIELWVDPESPKHPKQPELQRAIWFHSFTEG